MVLLTGWPSITDGDKNTGTVINKTNIWDVIKSAIETLVHSSTNPTVTPAAAIDEVVAARGSKADLEARLDVITNADGTLKSGIVSLTEVENARGSEATLDDRLDNGLNEDGTPIVAADGVTGAINSSDQVMGGGVKTFKRPMKFYPGSSSAADAIVSGRIYTNLVDVGNVGTGEDDLMSYPLKANALDADGKGVRITAYFTLAANANTKTAKFHIGSTSITLRSAADNAKQWEVVVEVYRVGAASQFVTARVISSSDNVNAVKASATETLSGAVTLKFTGEGTSDNDIVQNKMVVEPIG